MSEEKIKAGQDPMKVESSTMFTLRFDKGGRGDVRGNADFMRIEGSVEKVKQGDTLSPGDRLEYLRTGTKGSVWYKATIEKMVTSNPTMYMIHFDKGDNVEVRYYVRKMGLHNGATHGTTCVEREKRQRRED